MLDPFPDPDPISPDPQLCYIPYCFILKFPIQKFVAGDEEQYETCCICLDDYVLGDKLRYIFVVFLLMLPPNSGGFALHTFCCRILPCDHAYHVKCIDPWLLKNKRVCPQCRSEYLVLTSIFSLRIVVVRHEQRRHSGSSSSNIGYFLVFTTLACKSSVSRLTFDVFSNFDSLIYFSSMLCFLFSCRLIPIGPSRAL
jgi:hypothetical protein